MMKLDTGDFDRRFREVVEKAIPERLDQGMGKAALQLASDAINEEPKVPLDEGTLRGSVSVFVNTQSIPFPPQPEVKKKKNRKASVLGKVESLQMGVEALRYKNKSVAVVGFNTPYAARLHESPHFKFTAPGAGAKYLESKLSRNRERYMKIVLNAVKKVSS